MHLNGDISPWHQPESTQTLITNKPNIKNEEINLRQSYQINLRQSLPPTTFYFFQEIKQTPIKKSKQIKLSPLKILKNKVSQYEQAQQRHKKQNKFSVQNKSYKHQFPKQFAIPLITNSLIKYQNLKKFQGKGIKKNPSVPLLKKSKLKEQKKEQSEINVFFQSKSELFKDNKMRKMPKCKNIMFDYKSQFIPLKITDNSPKKIKRKHILDVLLSEIQ